MPARPRTHKGILKTAASLIDVVPSWEGQLGGLLPALKTNPYWYVQISLILNYEQRLCHH